MKLYHVINLIRVQITAIVLVSLIGCSSIVEPTFQGLENVNLNSLTLQKPYSVTLTADASFKNTNPMGANITEMDFDVFLNGKKATHIRQDLQVKMPANSEFDLPIKVKVPLKEVFQDLKLRDLYKLREFDYKLDGYLKLGLGNIEVKVPVTYEGHETMLR